MPWRIVELVPPAMLYIGDNIIYVATVYLLDDGERKVLVDPGAQVVFPIVRWRLRRLGVQRINLIIVTHMHGDHYFNIIFFLGVKLVVSRRNLEVWRENLSSQLGERARLFEELVLGGRELVLVEREVELLRGREAIGGDALLLSP